jgi:Mg-chelatase subunit ChlD
MAVKNSGLRTQAAEASAQTTLSLLPRAREGMGVRTRKLLVLCSFVLLVALATPVRAQTASNPQGALDALNSDVVLIIDHSGSMQQNDPSFLRLAAAKLFVDLADPGDKIGLVVMSGEGETRVLSDGMVFIERRNDIDELKAQIESLRAAPMGEETHTGTALELAYGLLDATPGARRELAANQRQFVVMLSDGLPTGTGQPERVDAAARRFGERGYWPVFSIALGAEADPDYLQRAVADPTGGEVVVANNANELIDSYLNVYARAGDDRYIDRVTVSPNTLTELARITADQQPTHLSVVLQRSRGARINGLFAPSGDDVVQPFFQNTVRRGAEPEYELYTVPPEAQVEMVGDWAINIAQGGEEPVTLVILSRSKLRSGLSVPAPLREGDGTSLRYHPLGRPLLLVAGAQMATPISQRADRYKMRWVTGMAPEVRLIAPQEGESITLSDNGTAYDVQANDGRYSGLFPAFEQEGDYRLRLDMPRRSDEPINIQREYTVRVTKLPTMSLELPPAVSTLPVDTPFQEAVG